MNSNTLLNAVTRELAPYPMEELAKIRANILKRGAPIYDFGTGDPKIPVWGNITDAIRRHITEISQYPSILGIETLKIAHFNYLLRRFGVSQNEDIMAIPSRGSKEAIFHIAQSLVGRMGRRRVVYPDPGYPVYKSSIQFAQGIPHPFVLNEENSYLLEPWKLSSAEIKECAAVWVNYPHNPTGAIVDEHYWKALINWCHKHDVVLLSDDCYVDIYDETLDHIADLKKHIPLNPLMFSKDRVLSFMSLSKRSGCTGHRVGFIAGDSRILKQHAKARANFGAAIPTYLQMGAVVAWDNDEHVQKRRSIFSRRMALVEGTLKKHGLIDHLPKATFYLWCRVPEKFQGKDVSFCLDLAKKGFISSPSSWLSNGTPGHFRLALVPEEEKIKEAMQILDEFISQ